MLGELGELGEVVEVIRALNGTHFLGGSNLEMYGNLEAFPQNHRSCEFGNVR